MQLCVWLGPGPHRTDPFGPPQGPTGYVCGESGDLAQIGTPITWSGGCNSLHSMPNAPVMFLWAPDATKTQPVSQSRVVSNSASQGVP